MADLNRLLDDPTRYDAEVAKWVGTSMRSALSHNDEKLALKARDLELALQGLLLEALMLGIIAFVSRVNLPSL